MITTGRSAAAAATIAAPRGDEDDDDANRASARRARSRDGRVARAGAGAARARGEARAERRAARAAAAGVAEVVHDIARERSEGGGRGGARVLFSWRAGQALSVRFAQTSFFGPTGGSIQVTAVEILHPESRFTFVVILLFVAVRSSPRPRVQNGDRRDLAPSPLRRSRWSRRRTRDGAAPGRAHPRGLGRFRLVRLRLGRLRRGGRPPPASRARALREPARVRGR